MVTIKDIIYDLNEIEENYTVELKSLQNELDNLKDENISLKAKLEYAERLNTIYETQELINK